MSNGSPVARAREQLDAWEGYNELACRVDEDEPATLSIFDAEEESIIIIRFGDMDELAARWLAWREAVENDSESLRSTGSRSKMTSRRRYDAAEVDWRVQDKANDVDWTRSKWSPTSTRVPYIDRLDSAVGAGNWSFDWTPVVIERGEVQVAKGAITIHGVSKSDVGTASNFEESLGCVSHCFKRAAVHWGVGRYLYNIPSQWVQVEKGGRLSATVRAQLRRVLEGGVSPDEERGRAQEAPSASRADTHGAPADEPPRTMKPALTLANDHIAFGTTAPELAQLAANYGIVGERWGALFHKHKGALPAIYAEIRAICAREVEAHDRAQEAAAD
jgi:hypothetical protein